jgi:hypothetical protein
MKKGFPSLKEEIKEVDEELSFIISKSTKKNQEERYQTMEEFHQDIKKYLYINGPTKLGPTREALECYIELIYTPGLETVIDSLLKNKHCHPNSELKIKIEQMAEKAPYMMKENNFYLEIIPNKNENKGYISINLQP